MSYLALFVEIDVICLIMLVIMYAKIRMDYNSDTGIDALKKLMICQMALSAADAAWLISQHNGLYYANLVSNMIFFGFSCFGAMYWLEFCQSRLNHGTVKQISKGRRLIVAIPAMIVALLAVTSPFTKLLFYIDDNCVYRRGPLYFVQVVALGLYVFTAAAISVYKWLHGKHMSTRHEAMVLSSFIVMPMIGYFIQLAGIDLPVVNPAIILSLFMVFINLQDIHISSDALTGLNNRRRADEYLEYILSSSQHRRIVFFLADIDMFKSINDKYGHLEGDRALKIAAAALRHVASEHNAFLARFGGDEFCIIWHPSDGDVSPAEFAEKAREYTRCRAEEAGIPYPMRISIGYAVSEPGSTPTSLIAVADAALYLDKKRIEAKRTHEDRPESERSNEK